MMLDLVLRCPHCNTVVDAHSNPDPTLRPDHGAVNICFYCGGVSLYELVGTDLTLRIPTAEELVTLDADEDVVAARKAVEIASTPQLAVHLYAMMTERS